MGIVVVPASNTTHAGLSAGEAISTFEESQGTPQSSSAPRTELMLATDGRFGFEDDTSTFSDRLAWVVSYAGTPAILRGGTNITESQREAIRADSNCTTTGIVDAETGDVLAEFQICH